MEELTEIPFEKSEPEDQSLGEEVDEEVAAPWLTHQTRRILNPNYRLHNEIIDFYKYIKPTEETNGTRERCFAQIKQVLEHAIPNSFVGSFGSFATQLYLPNSDVDLVILHDQMSIPELMKLTKRALKAKPETFSNIDVVNAKVPLIKFTMKEANLEFDITFNESKGITNAQEVITALQVHPEIKYLVFIVKLALRQRHMNNTFQGGIGSYLLFLLTLAFLRAYKKEQARDRRKRQPSEVTLSEYLVEFLNFWGKFPFHTQEIVIADGGRIQSKRRPSDTLTVYSPITNEDIGHAAFRFRSIFSMFKNRASFLCNYAYKENESILKYLLNPSCRDFATYLT